MTVVRVKTTAGWQDLQVAGPPGPPGTPARVTALPGSPADGQEVVYVADAANGVLWHLRHNAGSASAYKWEFVGGAALFAEVPGYGSTTVTTYVDLGGPAITLPLGGDYDIEIGAWFQQSLAANVGHWMSYQIGATAANDADGIHVDQWDATQPRVFPHASRPRRKTALAAVALAARYRAGSGGITVGWTSRWMRAIPVRVG